MKPFLSLIIVACVLMPGCSTSTGDMAADQRGRVTNAVLFEIAKAVGGSVLKTVTTTRKEDMAHSAVQGLWSNLGVSVDSNAIGNIINAWSGNELKPVAETAALEVRAVEAQTGPLTRAESRSIVGTIASAIAAKID